MPEYHWNHWNDMLCPHIWLNWCQIMPEYHWNHWIDPIVFPYILPVTQIALTGGIICICVCICLCNLTLISSFCICVSPFPPPQCKHKTENVGHAMGYNFFYVALLAQQTLQFESLISKFFICIVHQTWCCLNEIIFITSPSLWLFWFITISKTTIICFFLGSVYSVVAVALERYFNICKPFNRNLVSMVENDNVKSLGIWYKTKFSLSNSKVLDDAFECGQKYLPAFM